MGNVELEKHMESHIPKPPRQVSEDRRLDIELSLVLPVRTRNMLSEKKLHTVGDLVGITDEELRSISNFGEKTVKSIDELLKSLGFDGVR